MKHGIDCECLKCRKVRKFLKKKQESGEIDLIGCEEDLEKIKNE